MVNAVVKVLDTTINDNGPAQTVTFGYIKDDVREGGTRFFVSRGTGDTILIEGKAEAADASYVTLQTITASGIYDINLPPVWRARRSVDGGSADSTVRVINTRNADLVTHT